MSTYDAYGVDAELRWRQEQDEREAADAAAAEERLHERWLAEQGRDEVTPICVHCGEPLHRDVNLYWVGEDETSDCPANMAGHVPEEE